MIWYDHFQYRLANHLCFFLATDRSCRTKVLLCNFRRQRIESIQVHKRAHLENVILIVILVWVLLFVFLMVNIMYELLNRTLRKLKQVSRFDFHSIVKLINETTFKTQFSWMTDQVSLIMLRRNLCSSQMNLYTIEFSDERFFVLRHYFAKNVS